MRRERTQEVWTVVYPDPQNIVGTGVAYFDDEDEAAGFALAFKAHRVLQETVPTRITDNWTFTRWEPQS